MEPGYAALRRGLSSRTRTSRAASPRKQAARGRTALERAFALRCQDEYNYGVKKREMLVTGAPFLLLLDTLAILHACRTLHVVVHSLAGCLGV